MQVLFVAALKNQPCNLFGTPRHERNEWKQRLLPMRHTVRSRDQDQDWRVLTGDTSDILSTGTRSIRFLIVSTLTDTLLEWSFFLQDVAPYLELCARKRGLDLVVCDLRRGLREEDCLPQETVMAQLRVCQEQSSGVKCAILTGDKNGVCAVPNRIRQSEFEEMLRYVKDPELVKAQYELDENQLPEPEYILRGDATGLLQEAAWERWRFNETQFCNPNRYALPCSSSYQVRDFLFDSENPMQMNASRSRLLSVLQEAAWEKWRHNEEELRDPKRSAPHELMMQRE